MITLTMPDGNTFWVRPESIQAIHIATTGWVDGTKSILRIGGSSQAIKESPDEVLGLLYPLSNPH